MWQLKTRKQTQPVLHGANNMPRLLQWSKPFHQLHWGLAQAPGNKAFLMFFHVQWLFVCFFIFFCLLCLFGALSPLPLTELHTDFHSTKHPPPLQQRQLKSSCWLRKTSALFVYLGFAKDWFIKAFAAFDCDSNGTWISLSLVFNPFSVIAFRLRRAS